MGLERGASPSKPQGTFLLTLFGPELTFCSIFRTWPYNDDGDDDDNDNDNDDNDNDNGSDNDDDGDDAVIVVVVVWPNGRRTMAIARAHPGTFRNASWVCQKPRDTSRQQRARPLTL